MPRFLERNMVSRVEELERAKRQMDRLGLTSSAAESAYSRRYMLDGWGLENVPSSQSATRLYRFGNSEGWQRAVLMPRGGVIRGLGVVVNEARSSGAATVEVYVGGAASGVQAVLDAGATLFAWETAQVSFEGGEGVDLWLATSGWGPTSADLQAMIEVEWA